MCPTQLFVNPNKKMFSKVLSLVPSLGPSFGVAAAAATAVTATVVVAAVSTVAPGVVPARLSSWFNSSKFGETPSRWQIPSPWTTAQSPPSYNSTYKSFDELKEIAPTGNKCHMIQVTDVQKVVVVKGVGSDGEDAVIKLDWTGQANVVGSDGKPLKLTAHHTEYGLLHIRGNGAQCDEVLLIQAPGKLGVLIDKAKSVVLDERLEPYSVMCINCEKIAVVDEKLQLVRMVKDEGVKDEGKKKEEEETTK